MNPAHAVLRNCDILQVIMDFVNDYRRRDLIAVALVCRALSELALDVLWRHIDMDNLDLLFPKDILRVNHRGQKSLTRIPTTPQEWERFDVYASRIRGLWTLASSDDPFICGVRMRYPAEHHPFPNLTYLRWYSTPSESVDAIIFLCPTLTEVELTIDELGDDGELNDAVADVLWSLGEKCPQLKKFEYTHLLNLGNPSRRVETALIHLIRQCRRLEDVHLPIGRDLMRALGSLPHLSTLLLYHLEWEDGSQSRIPIQTDDPIEQADTFPVLDYLTIQGSHTVSSLTECFQGSGCFPRKSFAMREMCDYQQWSTLEIALFFFGIFRLDRREGLSVFWIDRYDAVQNPMWHDSWKPFRFLSFIPNLNTLSLNSLSLDINDTDLEEMSRILPQLHSLSLNVPHTDDYRSQISFQGLAHLSALEHLETVSLMLAPGSTISESMLSPSTLSNSRLKHLTIHGNFPSVTPDEAMFLNLHFPRLEQIHLLGRQGQRIIEIQAPSDDV